jgi:hypothetical protein
MRKPPPFLLLAVLLALPPVLSTCGGETSRVAAAPRSGAAEGPRARLRLSGRLEGRLEPCGCASGQVGGLARRSFRLQQDRGSYDFLIEGGDLTVDGSPLDELKLYTVLNVLDDARARYDAIGVGPGELRLDPDLLAGYVEAFPKLRFVCADLVPAEGMPWSALPFADLEAGDARVRVTALARALPPADAEGRPRASLLEPATAWQRAMDGVADDALRILLHHGSAEEARAAATLEPRPDLIVLVHASEAEPPREAELAAGGVPIVQPGVRGRFLVDLTLARIDGSPRLTRYQPLALEGSRTAKGAMEDADVRALVLAHRFEVEEDGTRERMAGRRPTATGAQYVGTARCTSCHYAAHEAYAASRHARAWETLTEAETSGRYPWPVPHYPDCVGCHSVGYGEQTGFVNPERTPDLGDVGCEACHGPASAHCEDPLQNRLGEVGADTCRRCHDFEQSPDFNYAARWPKIEHR